MIKIENTEVVGWEAAIRGMRNPLNSWNKSDSYYECNVYDKLSNDEYKTYLVDKYIVGPNDLDLMKKLTKAGTDHRKFMRMITVYADITAPLYWWKEFKTYRAGRKFGDPEPDVIDPELFEVDIETNSCSTMHKIHEKEFTLDDFSHEHLLPECIDTLEEIVLDLNYCRDAYIHYDEYIERNADFIRDLSKKDIWWQMIQLLPSSYNQKRTVMLNYEVLANMYYSRKNHKLDEWHEFCRWAETLPYSELITGID